MKVHEETRKGLWALVTAAIGLILIIVPVGACSQSKKDLVVIGDEKAVRPDEKEFTPSTLLMVGAGSAMDKPVKVRTEFERVQGTIGECLLVNTRLGPQDLDLCVNEPNYGFVRSLKPGTPILAIGVLSTAGGEGDTRLVLRVD